MGVYLGTRPQDGDSKKVNAAPSLQNGDNWMALLNRSGKVV